MSNRKYVVQDAGRGWISKLGTGIVATGSVAAAVIAVSPQGAALESLVYNPQAMQTGTVASGSGGGAPAAAESQASFGTSAASEPPRLEDYLVIGELPRAISAPQSDLANAPILGSILSSAQTGGSVGNVTNSTQYASEAGGSSSSTTGNTTNSTQTAGSGSGGNSSNGQNGNVTSPTPGGGEDSYGEDSYGEDSYGEDSYGEDSEDWGGEDSYGEDSRGED